MGDPEPKQTISSLREYLRNLPKRPILIGGAIGVSLLVFAFLAWPRQISFSYHQRPCIVQPMLLPGVVKSVSDGYELIPDRVVKIGNVPIAAAGVCIQPTKAPQPGRHQAHLTLFGLPFLGKPITIETPDPPRLSTAALKGPIPVSKPLRLAFDTPDNVFDYQLLIGGKVAECTGKEAVLECEVPALKLAQGTAYDMRIERLFGKTKITTATEKRIETLSATTVKGASLAGGGTVYSKPRSVELQLDKEIKAATASLVRTDGDRRTISVGVAMNGSKVTVSWPGDLERQAEYTLTLARAEAADGSSLVEPFTLPFKMSGGPRVASVSVGTHKVPLGATAVITFDQPLLEKQDLGKAITVSGGAKLSGTRGNQAFISFAGVPKCGDVTIKISNALLSNYEVAGGTAWHYLTRTTCHTIGSIGTSVQGRGITAYYFGSGPKAVIYTGAIHGDETSTRALMLRWTDELEAKARSIPADKTVVVVPTINPDGIASGRRTNARNVDLNRNFGTSDWRKDITTVTNAPFPGGGGESAMSEPETRAIAGLVSRLRPQLVLSYHSVGGVVAANRAGISGSRAGVYSNLSGYGNATGSTGSVFEYSVSGTAEDYYAEKLGTASILVELGSHTYHQFERNQKAMWAMLQ